MNLRIGMYSGNGISAGNQMAVNSQAGKNQRALGSRGTGNDRGTAVSQMLFGRQTGSGKIQQSGQSMFQIKRMLTRGSGQDDGQNIWGQRKSIVEEMTGYSATIRASREKAKNTSLELKKLQYSYTSVSSRILRSKTSVSARQAAGQARREVIGLERKRGSSDYDQEELEAAITHAKAMERVAKKKARHLEEEEMAKVSGGPCAGEMAEKEEAREEEAVQEDGEELADPYRRDSADMEEWGEAGPEEIAAEEISDAEIDSMTVEEMEELLAEMQQNMKEVLEESGLDDLLEELTAAPGEEMDPADYKMMKIKHRCKEMKDIVKADAEYLKVIFRKMEESKGKAIESMKGMGSGGSGNVFAGASFSGGGAPVAVHIDIPVSDAGMGAGGGDAPSVDVSV